MKTDEEKIKEWDDLTAYFEKMNTFFQNNVSPPSTPFPEGTLLERIKSLLAFKEPGTKLTGGKDIMNFIQHTKPFVEYLKIKCPKLLGPENDHGISLTAEMKHIINYFNENNIELPNGYGDSGAFYEQFAYLLRACNLLKEEQVSNQWWWEALVEKK
jgi:hypothetical protein